MAFSKYEKIGWAIARRKGAEFNKGRGPDIETRTQAIKVSTNMRELNNSSTHLRGLKKSRYVAVPSDMVRNALEHFAGTKIGVMTQTGKIKKRAGGL